MFQTAAPFYQEAIKKSGYDYTLKFDPTASDPPSKKKSRKKRDCLYFNPPYNYTVTTNVGKEFLALLDKCFPPGNPLRKILNRNTVKMSYSTTPNMAQIISGKNGKLLNMSKEGEKTCSCTKLKKDKCPLDQMCLSKSIVYQATVTQQNKKTDTYIGQTSVEFKARWAVHKQTFKDPQQSQTALSNHVRSLEAKNTNHTITWKLIDRGKSFSPVTGVCWLCVKEAFYILFKPELATLNSKSEIFSTCFHKKPALLIKKKRGRKPHGN